MCVIVAKFFPGIGWAGAKNRDRKYMPTLDFIEDTVNGVSRMMMHDQVTGYKEGINSHGVSILNTSLDVLEDEPGVESGKVKASPDGKAIAEALLESNPLVAIKVLINRKVVGCTIVFDKDTLYLMEASDQDGTSSFKYKAKKIPPNETVARTNHGILLPWAGYQLNVDPQQTKSRESSESRLKYAQQALEQSKTPIELLDLLAITPESNTQMNPLRTTTESKKMRTTAQEMIIPYEQTFFLRPIQSKLDIDFWKINQTMPSDCRSDRSITMCLAACAVILLRLN